MSNITDTDRINWLCDRSKVYAVCIQTQPHGETIHGELRAAIDFAMSTERKKPTTEQRMKLLETLRGVRTEREIVNAVNNSCSCGGKGPDDGCCQACEVWHRLNGRCTASLEAVAHSREPIPTGTRIWHLQHDTEPSNMEGR